MEVHHHPHVEKKRFREYFLEFVMIFLAVTLGFFAETIRENIAEHRRAKEFAASMCIDLEQDTAQLKSYRDYFDWAATNIDTLQQLLAHNDPKDVPSGKLYWYGLFGGAHRYFVANDETFQQMKSSGSLRYFNRKIALEVSKYDRFCRLLQSNEIMQENMYTEVRKLRPQIFDFRYNDMANTIAQTRFAKFDYSRVDSFVKMNPPLFTTDKIVFNQYVELIRSRFLHSTIVRYADSALMQASRVIGFLKKEYRIREE